MVANLSERMIGISARAAVRQARILKRIQESFSTPDRVPNDLTFTLDEVIDKMQRAGHQVGGRGQ